MGVFRIRTRGSYVSDNTRFGYRRYNVAYPSQVVTDDIFYIPAHQESINTIQDENHGTCYPECGGPYSVVSQEINYGKIGMYHGYDYIIGAKRNTRIYTGGWVKPYHTFSNVPECATSGVMENHFKDASEPIDLNSEFSKFEADGEAGFTRTRPKLEKLNLIESLSDLPKTVGMLMGSAERFSKTAKVRGDLYVEAQFGWLPFVRDVIGMFNLVINSETHINKIVKNNGSWNRISAVVSDDSKIHTNDLTPSTFYYVPATGIPQKVTHSVEFKRRTRFVGSFRYYIPGLDRTTFAGRFTALTVLSGLRITPSNCYNAIPWTWLGDWITGAGKWVDYYSSTTADDCAAKYAWLSHHVSATSSLSVSIKTSFATPTSRDVTTGGCTGTSSVKFSKKGRSGAVESFRFGGGPLTNRQALILHSIKRGRV